MSFKEIQGELEISLSGVEDRLFEMERRLAVGSPRDKVEAAGELEFLKQQKRDLEQRLARIEHLPDGVWATIREWLKEEAALLERRAEEWVVRH